MKRFLTVIAIIFVAIILFFSLSIAITHYTNRSEKVLTFSEYQQDFEVIVDFVAEEYDVSDEIEKNTMMIVTNSDFNITGLYGNGEDITLPEDVLAAFMKAKDIALSSSDEFIVVTKDRISFEGLGSNMYVYSRNGKKPNYFYSKNDGVIYITYKLKDNWYLLENIAR